jgi:hypothetical protein
VTARAGAAVAEWANSVVPAKTATAASDRVATPLRVLRYRVGADVIPGIVHW